MAKPTTKPSDRGRDNPEPGPVPGTRAGQRGTAEQLAGTAVLDDPAVEWERSEQDKLPPRGTGSQHNQGDEAAPAVEEPEAAPAVTDDTGLQQGGNKGPSNEGRNGSGR
jgi:hypothetical protein